MRNKAAVKRFGPLIFLAVLWLVILIVPSTNLLFRVQLGGSAMTQFSAMPSPADIPNFWEKAARRFPDDVNVLWQAANEYPTSEEPEEDAEYSDEDDDIAPPLLTPVPTVAPTPDSSLPPSQVFPGQLEGLPTKEKLRRLDLLIARFPQNADLIAARLMATIAWMSNGRVGGEMSDSKLYENQAAGKPSPERSQDKPNYTAADLKKAIVLAQRGGALEPDNGFFDWMHCCFLMYAWRDGEAFRSLDFASGKKRFDDHSLAAQNARLTALSVAFNRRLLFEEKLQDYNENLYFSQGARYREMARILAWQSIKAQRKGDHQKALRITAGLARTAARMRENSKTYIEGLVASAIEAIALSSPTYDARAARRGGARRTSPQQRISSFQTYATKYGRPELAAEAGRNAVASGKFRTGVAARISNGSIYGASFWTFIFTALLWTTGVLWLLLLPLPCVLLAIFAFLSRIPRVREVLRLHQSSAEEIPHLREVWSGALACGGVRALSTAICGALVVGLAYLSLLIGMGQSGEITKFVTDFQSNATAAIGYFNQEGIYYLLSARDATQSGWRWVVALSPVLFGILFCAWRATEFQKRQNGEVPFSTRAFFQSLLQGHAFRSPSGARDDLDVTAAFLKLTDWFLMLVLISSWIELGSVESNDAYSAWLIPLALTGLFSGVLLWEKIALWRARPHRFQTLRFGLRLWKRSLGAWLVLGSALYFASLFISLPARQNIERGVDRVLRLGEVGAGRPDAR